MEFTGRFVGGLRIDLESHRIELIVQCDQDDIGPEWDDLRNYEKLAFCCETMEKETQSGCKCVLLAAGDKTGGQAQHFQAVPA